MKTLYLDAGMGAAGDMLTAALLELCPDREAALAALIGHPIPSGVFGAEMQVALVNDGPVTICIDSKNRI